MTRYKYENVKCFKCGKQVYAKNMCKSCYTRDWQIKNEDPEKKRLYDKEQTILLREKVFKILGKKCKCCGETEMLFLTVDHVKNNGAEERRSFNGSTKAILIRIVRSELPKEDYQTFCMNCNHGKMRNKGICPHSK